MAARLAGPRFRSTGNSETALKRQKNPKRLKLQTFWGFLFLEAPPGIEPGMKVLQTSALPLGYGAILYFYTLWIPEICPFGPVFGGLGAGLSSKRGSKLSAGLPKPSIHSETGM